MIYTKTRAFRKMQLSMVGASKNFEIFDSVVRFISVYVMHVFLFCQYSIQMFFHNQPVFKDISFSGFKRWMFRCVDQNISLGAFGLSPLPKGARLPLHAFVPSTMGFSFHGMAVRPSSRRKFIPLSNIYQAMSGASQNLGNFLIGKLVCIKELNEFIFINMGSHKLIIT